MALHTGRAVGAEDGGRVGEWAPARERGGYDNERSLVRPSGGFAAGSRPRGASLLPNRMRVFIYQRLLARTKIAGGVRTGFLGQYFPLKASSRNHSSFSGYFWCIFKLFV